MDIADRIGLLSGFGWLADHGFLMTVIICFAITPFGHLAVGFIGESRWVPVSPKKQFLSFFPGDFFLGLMLAGLLVLAARLPDEHHFYNERWFHLFVLVVTFSEAIAITRSEYKDPNGYGHRAVLSPTKLYHNILLYGAYGYVIVVTLVATFAALWMHWDSTYAGLVALCLLPGLVWVSLLVVEQRVSDEIKQERVKHAHVNDWEHILTLP